MLVNVVNIDGTAADPVTREAFVADLLANARASLYQVATVGIAGSATNTTGVLVNKTAQRLDTDFSLAANVLTFTGSPDHIEININLFFGNENAQREAPGGLLQKFSGSWQTISEMYTGYMRISANHNDASLHCAYIDGSPGLNPQYRVLILRAAANNTSVIDNGSMSVKAWL